MQITHKHLQAHHKYQLELIGLFLCSLFLLVGYYVLIEDVWQYNIHTWQWLFFWPWLVIYVGILLIKRNRIPKQEQISPKKRHLIYWICLGVALILWYSSPLSLEKPITLYYMYGIFSLFLADSYWDFTQ